MPIFFALLGFLLQTPAPAAPLQPAPGNPVVVIETSAGTITAELFKDRAPVSTENFLQLRQGRALCRDHLAPGGVRIRHPGRAATPPRWSRRATRPPIQNEATNGLGNRRGTLAMARLRSARSATSQFYINVANNAALDHRGFGPDDFGYAVFGRVLEGMDVVDKIASVPTTTRDGMESVPVTPVLIKSVTGELSEEIDVSRPLLIIFLTILVNLIGFGIIIPLLPFYAETFGASPLTIGLLFASFSLAQLFASPLLGAWSDRWGRRPVLIFSLIGTVVSFVMLALAHSLAMLFAARIVDGLSGGNITTARAYIGDIATEENRAKSFGDARRGVRPGLHHRPGSRRPVRAHQLYRADLGGRRHHRPRDAAGVVLAARNGPSRGRRGRLAVESAARAERARRACAAFSRSTSSIGDRSPSTRRRSRCSAPDGSASTRPTPDICSRRSGSSA